MKTLSPWDRWGDTLPLGPVGLFPTIAKAEVFKNAQNPHKSIAVFSVCAAEQSSKSQKLVIRILLAEVRLKTLASPSALQSLGFHNTKIEHVAGQVLVSNCNSDRVCTTL